jgi:DNA polymerase-3 subunit delta
VAGGEDVLLISAGRIDRQSQQSKWYKALERAGATIQVWPVNAGTLPGWLRRRVSAAGMRIDEDALQLLAERVEGNLLAAVQELKKLELLAGDGGITAQTVIEAVSDNARYSLFGMADSALGGDAAASLRMLRGLRGEGTEPPVALWALVRELRTLFEVRQECDRGSSPEQALSARRVWKSRIPLLRGALSRHDGDSLSRLLELAAAADGCIKGYAAGDPWDNLEQLVTGLALRSR